jgi:small subunit ribosomal protein S21
MEPPALVRTRKETTMSTQSTGEPRVDTVTAQAGQTRVPPERRGGHALLTIQVQNNDVDFALRLLKRQMQKSGLIRELRRRQQYEKPSERRRRHKREGIRNTRKRERLARG